MKLHILRCGSMSVSPSVPFGNALSLSNTARQLFASADKRVELPVWAFLLEHPRGPILVDAGWCRDLSPKGIYDSKAVRSVLPAPLAAFYRPTLPLGCAVDEQLAALSLRPEDLEAVILTHLDPDHVAGLRHLRGARRVILPEDEYFWACRAVYKHRQPWSLWMDTPMERPYYRGSPLGPNHWAIDVFGDESLTLVNVPAAPQRQTLFDSGGGRGLLPPQLAGGYLPRLRLRSAGPAQSALLAAGDGGGPRLCGDPLQPRPGPGPLRRPHPVNIGDPAVNRHLTAGSPMFVLSIEFCEKARSAFVRSCGLSPYSMGLKHGSPSVRTGVS